MELTTNERLDLRGLGGVSPNEYAEPSPYVCNKALYIIDTQAAALARLEKTIAKLESSPATAHIALQLRNDIAGEP